MKQQYLTALFMLCAAPCMAQQSFVALGGDGSANSGSVSYSVGQLNYLSAENSASLVVEGMQQPQPTGTEGIAEALGKDIDITAVPNPTTGYVYLSITEESLQHFQYQVTDMGGRRLLYGQAEAVKTALDLSSLSAGTYLLSVWHSGRLIKRFKIIKNR